MPSGDVLIDIGWALERDDMESILHVDSVRQDVVASAFDGKGPLRVVTKASIAHRGVECSSFEDERDLQDAAELLPYLRNAYIKTFEIDCSYLDIETARSLLELKEYFVIDNLKLRSNAFHLIDGALDCRTLIWQSRNYDQDGSEVEQDYGDYVDYDENQMEELNKRYAFLKDFFKLRTVRNAENLDLLDIPYVHLQAVSSWLQDGDANSRVSGAKELHVWWDSYQGNGINALIAVLEQALFTYDGSPKTSLVQSMDGPKVWKFRTPRELEKHILGNNVYELLARSGLIANEMICKCGSRMHLRIMRRWWDREGATWRCSGNCKNRHGETLHVMPTFGSWFSNFGQHLHEDSNIKDPIEKFYMAVMRKETIRRTLCSSRFA